MRELLRHDEFKGIDRSILSMDGAMTKAPLGGGGGPNPTDRAKCGTKRSIVTDGNGIPIGVVVEGADRNDFKLAGQTLASIAVERPESTPENPQGMGMCMDHGRREVLELLEQFGFTAHIRRRGEEAAAIKGEVKFKVKLWVVERAHSWMNRFRAILIRWSKMAANYLGMLHLALGLIAWRASRLPR